MATMPCMDNNIFLSSETSQEHSHSALQTEHTHEESEESCSPICICACCGVSVNEIRFDIITSPERLSQTNTKLYNHYRNPYSSLLSFEIWTPPQA